jgi:hypothetical protein
VVSLGGVVALGNCRTGELTHKESVIYVSNGEQDENPFRLTIQAKGMAQPGMSSLQKLSTVERAVISKGISKAS